MKASTYAILVTVMVLAGGLGAYFWGTQGHSSESVPIVKQGDTISVKYYGYIYYGGERRIFDTNIEKVAKDNISYPKTVSFKWRNDFEPLTFKVGDHTMIPGFENGVIGMKLNETKTIVVPPSEGYPFDWSKVQNYSLVQTIPVIENLSIQDFKKRFGQQNPLDNAVYRDKVHGWNCLILQIDATKGIVTILNEPNVGKYYQPYKNISSLKIYVEKIKDGKITFKYDIESLPILLPNGGIIDWKNNTMFRVNHNQEVAGKTLYFVVTVIKIKES